MKNRVKILMAVMDFYQAGAQRYAYEIDQTLDKSKFEVSILSVRNLKANLYFDDYYYEKHKQLGSTIYFSEKIIDVDKFLNRVLKKIILNRFTIKFLKENFQKKFLSILKSDDFKRKNLNTFLEQFDIINWIGEYTPTFLFKYLDKKVFSSSFIHIMNFKFQNALYYHLYPKNVHYTFISGFENQAQLGEELSEFSDYSHFYFPICLKVNSRGLNKRNEKKEYKKIGIFTRLDPMKPLDVFFAAFHLLLDKLPDSELHVFGAGDPTHTGLKRLANNFYILNKVLFRGHQRDIVQTAVDEQLDLVWFQGYKNRPGGYARL